MYRSMPNNVVVGAAPFLLDRAQVNAYSHRIRDDVILLGAAVDARKKETGGVSGDEANNVAYNPANRKLPYAWWISWIRFKNEMLDFDEKIEGFDLLGPTVWSTWATLEGFETRQRQFRKDFTGRLGGHLEGGTLISQIDIDAEHPSQPWISFSNSMALVPWVVLAGLGGFWYLSQKRGSL